MTTETQGYVLFWIGVSMMVLAGAMRLWRILF